MNQLCKTVICFQDLSKNICFLNFRLNLNFISFRLELDKLLKTLPEGSRQIVEQVFRFSPFSTNFTIYFRILTVSRLCLGSSSTPLGRASTGIRSRSCLRSRWDFFWSKNTPDFVTFWIFLFLDVLFLDPAVQPPAGAWYQGGGEGAARQDGRHQT